MTLPGQVVFPGNGLFLPRMIGPAASARAWNTVDAERAALGSSFRAYRTTAVESVPVAHTPNVDIYAVWQAATGTGDLAKWSLGAPDAVTVLESATYLIIAQLRFAATGPYGRNGSTDGWRKCRIMLNGLSAPQHTIASSPPLRGSITGAGTTCQAIAVRPLRRGDVLYMGARHSSTPPITLGNPDAGGTYISLTRVGPAAPT